MSSEKGAVAYGEHMVLTALILGSGATAPTKTRGVSATLLSAGHERILVDCGEGTGRQLLLSGAGLGAISTLLLTHGHADHYLGLPGLLKTWAAHGRTEPLLIAGTPGTWQLLGSMQGFIGPMPYKINILEPEPGETISGEGYTLTPARSDHRIISYAWAFEEAPRRGQFNAARADADQIPDGAVRGALARGESVTLPDGRTVHGGDYVGHTQPGRRIVFSGDTRPCDRVAQLADDADLLIHEATFHSSDADLARKTGHSTATEAATLASRAGVSHLVLNHLSSRYPASQIHEEAERVFPATTVADDFDMFTVPYRNRGHITHTKMGEAA